MEHVCICVIFGFMEITWMKLNIMSGAAVFVCVRMQIEKS